MGLQRVNIVSDYVSLPTQPASTMIGDPNLLYWDWLIYSFWFRISFKLAENPIAYQVYILNFIKFKLILWYNMKIYGNLLISVFEFAYSLYIASIKEGSFSFIFIFYETHLQYKWYKKHHPNKYGSI